MSKETLWQNKSASSIMNDIDAMISKSKKPYIYHKRKYFIRSSKGTLFENIDGKSELFYPSDAYAICNKIIQEGGWAVPVTN